MEFKWTPGNFIAPDRRDTHYLRAVRPVRRLEAPEALLRRIESYSYQLAIEVDAAAGPVTIESVRRFELQRNGRDGAKFEWVSGRDRWNDYLTTLVVLGLKHAKDAVDGAPEAVRSLLTPSEVRTLGGPVHGQFNYRTRGRGRLDAFFADPLALERAHLVRHRADRDPLLWLFGGVSVHCRDAHGLRPDAWTWPALDESRRPLSPGQHHCAVVKQCLESLWGPTTNGSSAARRDAIDRFISPDAVIRNVGAYGSVCRGRAGYAALNDVIRGTVTNESFEIRDLVALSDDAVLVVWNEVLWHVGDALGIEPTGRRIEGCGATRVIFREGLMHEGGEEVPSGNALLFALGVSADDLHKVHPVYLRGGPLA